MATNSDATRKSELKTAEIHVRYSQTAAVYANQFVINAGDEDLVIDCSSGLVVEQAGQNPILPIHTRLAVTWGAAQRLKDLLEQALSRQSPQASVEQRHRPVPIATDKSVARLPTLDESNA